VPNTASTKTDLETQFEETEDEEDLGTEEVK
jgi:hypothetical protein